jgi:hypothetical protein
MTSVRISRVLTVAAACFAVGAPSAAAQGSGFSPGAWGIGDPYFPLEGNGGYDVKHYDLTFSYDPGTDRLEGTNKITARATQNLYGTATTEELIALSAQITGQDLSNFFQVWLYTPEKPKKW